MVQYSQNDTPLLSVLQALALAPDTPFYAPGHKRGRGIAPNLKEWLGKAVFQADLPELPALDNLFAPTGAITEAQHLAADLWGAERTWFLVNGSTAGIIAAILATCGEGDKLLLPRNVHQAAIAGVIHAGAIPIFLEPECHPDWDLAFSTTPNTLQQALTDHADVKALLLLHPTYHGVGGDLAALIALAHGAGLPVIVDEAHGAHFVFHPHLPPSAVSLGADLTIQSTHKLLGALSQASMLHGQGDRVDPQRVSQALQLIQSTSPNYLLLASLDAARHHMAHGGQELLHNIVEHTLSCRQRLAQIPGLKLLDLGDRQSGFTTLDPTRLTVDTSAWGLSGFALDEILSDRFQITAELPTLRQLSFIVSVGNTAEDLDRLGDALHTLSQEYFPADALTVQLPPLPRTELALSPRRAAFAPRQTLAPPQAIGKISADLLCPYPPGIPVLVPGEIITAEAIAYLEQVLALGGTVSGLPTDTLDGLRVVDDS